MSTKSRAPPFTVEGLASHTKTAYRPWATGYAARCLINEDDPALIRGTEAARSERGRAIQWTPSRMPTGPEAIENRGCNSFSSSPPEKSNSQDTDPSRYVGFKEWAMVQNGVRAPWYCASART